MLEYDDCTYDQLEYDYFDGETFHFLTILDLNKDKDEITVVIQYFGKISVVSYDLYADEKKQIYFEYGPSYEKIYIDDFSWGD